MVEHGVGKMFHMFTFPLQTKHCIDKTEFDLKSAERKVKYGGMDPWNPHKLLLN